MEFLNSAVLFILIVLVFIALWHGPRAVDGARPLISSYNIFLILFFIYVVFSASLSIIFNDSQYTWAKSVADPSYIFATLVVCLYAFVIFIFGYRYGYDDNARAGSLPRSVIGPYAVSHHSRNLAFGLVLLGVLLKIYVTIEAGGVSESLMRMSGGIRQSLRIEALNPLIVNIRTLSGIADAGAVWILLYAMRRKSGYIMAGAIFSCVMLLTYFTIGKRLVLAWPFISVALGYHFYVRRITMRAAPWVIGGILIVGLISLFYRIFLPAIAANVVIDLRGVSWANGSLLSFYFYSLEFSTFEMITLSIFEGENIASLFGGAFDTFVTTNIVPFFYAVPRVLWSEKPQVFFDISHAVTATITGVPVESITAGVATTLIGTSWIIGSLPGLTIAMFLYGWLCNWIDKPLRLAATFNLRSIIIFSFLLNAVVHLFRQGTLGWIFIITVVQQYGMILGYVLIFSVAGVTLTGQRSWKYRRARTSMFLNRTR